MGLEKITNTEAEKLMTREIKRDLSISSKINYALGIVSGAGTGFGTYVLTHNIFASIVVGVAVASPWIYSAHNQAKDAETQNG